MNDTNFLEYINNPMDRDVIHMLYRKNNINIEKCGLYCDFTQSLIITIFDTYLGDDITDIGNQVKHFVWSWNKVIDNFIDEGLDFDNDNLYNYFLEFMLEAFYIIPDKDDFDFQDKKILKLWNDIFDYDKIKTKSEIDVLIEIYVIFEKALKII